MAALLASAGAAIPGAQAQSADALIDKLVEKGILNSKEAQELRDEADKGFTTAYSVKSGLPDWVTALKFNGDMRGRFEGFYAENPASVDRHRMRYRLRFGVTANLQNDFEVGFRLGSGDLDGAAAALGSGLDPISNNQTFQNNASKKGIFLDLAYAKWSPLHTPDWSGSVALGKIENPFTTSDLVFDNDYTPEGVAVTLSYNLSQDHVAKWATAGFALDELSGNSQDPWLAGTQLRLDSMWNKHVSTSFGAGLLAIQKEQNLKNRDVPNSQRGNTRGADEAPVHDFSLVYADAGLTYSLESFPMYEGPFPIRLSGDYLRNIDAAEGNEGFSLGVLFGKSGKKGLWDVSYTYKFLGADAWYEEFTDSDTGTFYQTALPNSALGGGYGGGTNLKGHVVRIAYSPFDSLVLSAKWYGMEAINESPADSESMMHRIQVDAAWKF